MTTKKKPAVTAAEVVPSRVVRLSKVKKTAAAIAAGDYSDITDRDVAALDAARKAGLLPVPADYEEAALARAVHRVGEPPMLALTPEQEEIVSLLGQLRDAEAARERAVTALRKDLDAADISVAQAETVAREALHDLATALARIKDLEASAVLAQSKFREQLVEADAAIEKMRTGTMAFAQSLNDEVVGLRRANAKLKEELAHAQRGWIAKLFRRPAGGRA